MAKKLKISSIFKKRETIGARSERLFSTWPSCTHSKTLSFRADDNILKTINSVFFDPFDGIETPNSSSDQSSASNSISTESHDEEIIKGARSERLFFEPGATSSIIFQEEPKKLLCRNQEQQQEGGNQEIGLDLPFKESVILAMESKDPYLDFKNSMKEMVETQGIKDWLDLQELLAWYLKLNGEVNHGFVLGAFVDLLMELVFPTTPLSTNSDNSITSYSSSSFSCPSSPLSLAGPKEIEGQENEKVP